MPLLQVRDLSIQLQTHRGPAYAVRDVGFSLERGETLGLVGESGCGKSITALALMGLLPENARVSGSIRLGGQELVGAGEREMTRLRGDRMAMVFQEPMTALNPVHTVGRQVAEPLRLHRGLSSADARREAVALLDRVGIPHAARRIEAYPHQFSGGQRQRITIAMALACGPDLLIADEPTTALDVTVQRQILELIRELVAERGMGLILISHDLGVIAQNASRMLVMYGGRVVESGTTAEVFAHRMHPYTLGLFGARPGLHSARGQRLATIPGTVPELVDLPPGCPFAGRCAFTIADCHGTVPPPYEVESGHHARCIRLDAVAMSKQAALTPAHFRRERE
ncbi:ABC transporter ATP-binding protein [Ramlibacter tataouinensis]|uniref:Candidate ABC type dipeptide/oligopeptide transport system, ATP-binding component n=1 Tax=Ramlibacter tataouinensis (strain ATCC BAA-407 / DSM 14655 / LMG 21543 / TTB310) TaxID=365046 RepID=F5XYT1_RAMTT|nr:ABC transporter ATP-binding protein [Ramlibacter tataouinensis]AEG94448.1 candidate ABC type dipeptide/oligopeptide transport system, ATP-binding component [Ramlibacter tataouinensis TTB310]